MFRFVVPGMFIYFLYSSTGKLTSYMYQSHMKADGVLVLKSHLFKRISKTTSAIMKGFPKATSSYMHGFLTAAANSTK